MEEKTKAYVLCTKTFREIEKISANRQEYRIDMYSLDIDRSDLSEEQKKIQERNNWYTNASNNFKSYDVRLDEMVENEITDEVLNKCRDNIPEKVLNNILDTEVRFLGIVEIKNNDSIGIVIYTEIGNERNDRYEYSNDIKEFEELAKKATKNVSFTNDGEEVVYIEKISADISTYSFNDFTKVVTKEINKYIRNNLTYCLKNGKLIIPDEYLDKGKNGIEEWRNIRSSKNKSNSIENKLIKETVNKKKQYAYDSVCRAIDKVTSVNNSYDWTIPQLTIDGRWNKQRRQKLAAKILDTKNKQKIIEMSEQDIVDKTKEYWKQILMNAYNEVDKLEI